MAPDGRSYYPAFPYTSFTGMSDADMVRWHVEFERMAPSAHADFLEALGIAPAEVRRIRRWSRAEASDRQRGR